jgi:hypothetical protein
MSLAPAGETAALTALLTGRYVSLHTGIPTGGNEVSGGAYARQSATFTQSGSDPTVGANDANIEYPAATGSWGTITYVGLYSALSGGSLIAYEALTTPKSIGIDDVFRFKVGQLSMSAT